MLKGTIKGTIIAPPNVRVDHVDKFRFLLEALSKDTGFPIQWKTNPSIPKGCEVVIAYGTPLRSLVDLDKKIKLISMVCDIHTQNQKVRSIKHKLWHRADSIWTFEDENFKRAFLRWYHKHVWVPMFFAPNERYTSLEYNNHPKRKCLLSGCAHLPWYPLRNYVDKHGDSRYVDKYVMPIHNWQKKGVDPWRYSRDSYAKWLNQYFCCVTGSGNDTFHAKCVEISAAGSLLLTNMIPDMARAGFIPKVHYLPVSKEDVLVKIKNCIRSPQKFEPIRRAGMKLSRARHSVEDRRKQLVRVIERIMNNENMGAVNCEWM